MQLKAIQTYQAVQFQGKTETFLSAKVGMDDLVLEIIEPGVVSAKTAKDHIYIFTTNIAYARPMPAKVVEAKNKPK